MMISASRIPNVILSTGAILSVCNTACSSITSSGFNGSGLLDTRNQHLSQEPDNAAGVS